MKNLLVLLMAAVMLTGCVRYDVTLNNGRKITNVHKPKLNAEAQTYTITSAAGKKFVVPASRIAVIEPHQKEKFKNAGSDSQFLPSR